MPPNPALVPPDSPPPTPAGLETAYRVLEHIPAAICLLRGPEHRYEYLNAAYQAFFPNHQFLGRTVAEVLPEVVAAGFMALLDGVYRTGITHFGHETPLTLAAHDGHPARDVYFTFTYQACREAGVIVGISVFAYEVTAQVRQREAEQQQQRELFEQAPVAIAVFRGPRYVVEWANLTMCALWGRTPAQALGTPVFELLPEAAGQGFEELLDGVLATGTPYVAHERPSLIDRQGRRDTVYWNFMYQPLREADGRITGITVVATDVSEQVQARRQVLALNEQLATTNATLLATNAELGLQNAELRRTHQQLQRLNHTLDARVAERTAAARLARAEAERQRARLKDLFMSAPAAICMLAGPELVYELVNPVYAQWLPGRELLGRTVLAALPEVAHLPAYEALRRVYDTGITYTSPAQLVPLAHPTSGELEDRYFNLIFQARYDEHDHIDGVLVFGFEVTEQVAARDACETVATRLQLITDALPVLIGYVDREQRYQFNNHAYEAWFGQKPKDLLGRTVREVVGEAAYQATQGYMARALAGEQLDFEARMPYRKDFVRHIHSSFVPDVREGVVMGYYSLVTDVSEEVRARKQVQRLSQQSAALNDKLFAANEALADANEELGVSIEELGKTNEQLTRTNVDLDTFVYTASHDLKGPITNLDGLVHALWEELPPASQVGPVAHILNLMQSSVDRFQHTLVQLSAIGQLQQERGQPLAPTRLADVIRDVRLDLAPLILAARAQLVVDIAGFPSFPFSEKNLRSVVYNLLSNALKYRHPDREAQVRLSCRLEAPYWVLAVADNGLGLALTPDRPLFGLFQRYHTHVEGSGVGLYMVKKMLENAGGHIEVQSELGVGSTFTAYFRY
ncbi:PAS domain-containing protein [Hymenobacter antarcticus]|uniref:histidine kinase n=1 Tax=Hymenobacter antarcticus TaxID=486270 RepID=A0ABP7R680_9BACT